jgi:hypothetical protein
LKPTLSELRISEPVTWNVCSCLTFLLLVAAAPDAAAGAAAAAVPEAAAAAAGVSAVVG